MTLARGILTLVGIGAAVVIGYVVYQKIGESVGKAGCTDPTYGPIYKVIYPGICAGTTATSGTTTTSGSVQLPPCDPKNGIVANCIATCTEQTRADAISTVQATVDRNTQQGADASYDSIVCGGAEAAIMWISRTTGVKFYTPIDMTPFEYCQAQMNPAACRENLGLGDLPQCAWYDVICLMGPHQ